MEHGNEDRFMRSLGIALLFFSMSLVPRGPALGLMDLSWFTIDGGGATACTGGIYALGGTIGQPEAGQLAAGSYALLGGFWKGGAANSGVGEDVSFEVPLVSRISPSFPNPFHSTTSVLVELTEPRYVRAKIYDLNGRLVRSLCDGLVLGGRRVISWNGRSDDGRPLASGVYLLTVQAGTCSASRSVILIR